MAERTSTRTASRRSTPQPAAQPAVSTRKTRSQSRDVSDSEEARIGIKARRGGKQTLSNGAENRAGQSIRKGMGRTSVNQPRALQDLSMVAEDPSIAYPEIQVDNEDEEDEEQPIEREVNKPQANVQSKSPGGVSAFSGTTARTSRSTQDLSDLSTEGILGAFADLLSASDQMLRYLIPREISEASITAHMAQLQTKRSSANNNMTRLATMLSANRDMFGSESYIAIQDILGTLVGKGLGSNDNPAPWRPDALLQKANLAVLASSIFSHSWRTQDAQLVEELEQLFPMPFLEGFLASETPLAGYSQLSNETFQLALDIRTQYAVMLLARHARQPNFDPNAVLLQVFYEDDKALRGWGVGGLRAEDLTGEDQHTILLRLEKLRATFASSEDDFATDLEPLQSSFPWTTLVLQTIRWTSLRLAEINRQISVHHGAERIIEALRQEVQRARLANSLLNDDGANDAGSPQILLEYDFPPEAETVAEPQDSPRKLTRTKTLKLGQFSANSPKALAATDYVKRLEASRKSILASEELSRQQNQQATSDIQVTATAGPPTQAFEPPSSTDESVVSSTGPAKLPNRNDLQPEDDWQAQEGDDDPLLLDPEEKLRQTTSQAYAMRAQRQAESNKENIGISVPQPELPPGGRQKPRFIDPQANAQRLGFVDSQELDRETPPSQMDDPSQDEGFQVQHAATDIAQRRSLKPALKRSAPQPQRPERSSPKRARILEVRRSGRPEIVQDRPNVEPSPSPMDEYRAANSSAKGIKTFQPKPPQTRRPWSEEETETLLTLIEEHGTSWALLLAEDKSERKVLQSRGQVALKDKARNMKMDYLKSSTMLPANFERIPMSKIHTDTLTGLGIQYDHETGRRVDAFVEDDDE